MAGPATKRSVLLFAALLGLVTSLLTYNFLKRQEPAAKTVPVVVTTQEIRPLTKIEDSMVTIARIPADRVPTGVYLHKEDVVGKFTIDGLAAGATIPLDGAREWKRIKLSEWMRKYGKKMRAVAVSVDPVIGVAGLLQPGDRVDVLATFDTGERSEARTVLQNVLLMALGHRLEKEESGRDGLTTSVNENEKDTATLLVTPDEAQRLVLAENKGKLRLVLRPADDEASVPLEPVISPNLGRTATGERRDRVEKPAPRERTATHPQDRTAKAKPNAEPQDKSKRPEVSRSEQGRRKWEVESFEGSSKKVFEVPDTLQKP